MKNTSRQGVLGPEHRSGAAVRMGSAMTRWARGAFVVVAILTLAGVVSAAPENEVGRPRQSRIAVGEAPPALTLERIAGSEQVTLNGLNGRVVILDFWATWCSPCREVMPALDAMYRRHRTAGLSVIGMSSESDEVIRAHARTSPVDYTVARDIGGTMQRYGVRGIPTMIVLDRRGRVREVFVGVDGASMSRLEGLVTQLLAERR
jgi:thiol-disulfide isomerase/thioredoxin